MSEYGADKKRTYLILGIGGFLIVIYLLLAFRLNGGEANRSRFESPTAVLVAQASVSATDSGETAVEATFTPQQSEAPALEPTATPAPTATQVPTATPVPRVIVPTPLGLVPEEYSIGGGSAKCENRVVVIVYSDDNQDQVPSFSEGISGLQVVILDSTFVQVGSAYTREGRATFCLPQGKMFYVDIPYLQITRTYNPGVGSLNNQNVLEIRIDPPILPVRLP